MKEQKQNAAGKNTVYLISVVISVVIAVWGIASSKTFEAAANFLMVAVKKNLSWLYLLAMLFFVIFAVAVACSK